MENTKSSLTPELNEIISKYSPYLFEIKKRLLYSVVVFLVATLGGFIFYETIIRFLINILRLNGINIVFTSPFQFINLAINCGIATGLVFVFPLLTYQIFSFLRPALKKREFKILVGFIPFSLILFVTGFVFGFLIMKWQIEIFLTKSISLGIGNVLDISRLLSTVLITSVLMGISFQFPIIIFLLSRFGIIKNHHLSKRRLWVYLGAFFFSILLPADSILADIFLTLPIILLFEITLFLNYFYEKKKATLVAT